MRIPEVGTERAMRRVSESDANPRLQRFSGRRRVHAVIAIPVVLLCGALGAVAGVMFPMRPAAVLPPPSSPEAAPPNRELPPAAPVPQDGIALPKGDAGEVSPAAATLPAREPSAAVEAVAPLLPKEPRSKDAASASEERQRQRRRTFERMVRVRRDQHAQLRRRGPSGQASPKKSISAMPLFGPVAGMLLP
jgi:hypothetical protein